MFQKLLVIFSVALVSFLFGCYGDQWDGPYDAGMKEEMSEKAKICDGKEHPGLIDKFSYMANICNASTQAQYVVSTNIKCWTSCIFVEMGMIKILPPGSPHVAELNLGVTRNKINNMQQDKETKQGFMEIMKQCDLEIQKSDTKCESGFQFVKCVCQSFKQKKAEKAPRQGEVGKDGKVDNGW